MFRPLASPPSPCSQPASRPAVTTSSPTRRPRRPRRHRSRRSTALTGRGTDVAGLDKGFVQALGTLKLTPTPVGTAKITTGGDARFPITGGNVTYYKPGSVAPYVQGQIDHTGSGLSLTGGGKTVEADELRRRPRQVRADRQGHRRRQGRRRERPAVLPRRPHAAAAQDGRLDRVLQGTTVKLKDEAATLLNDTFGTDALKGGLVIGVAKITVNVA